MNTVTDFEIFIRNGSLKNNLSGHLLQEYNLTEKIIKSGLDKAAGPWHDSGILCKELKINKDCDGNINIKKTDIPHKITWACSICASSGEILNWKKSPAYRESIQINTNSKIHSNLILPRNDYNELNELCSIETDFCIIINSAVEENSYFHINIAELDILRIIGYISEKINATSPDIVRLSYLRQALLDSYSPGKTAFY